MADDAAAAGLGFEIAADMRDLNNSVAFAALDELYEGDPADPNSPTISEERMEVLK